MFGSVYHSGAGYFPSAPLHNIPSRLTFEPEKYDDSRPRGPEANRWLREEYAEWQKEERIREAKRRGFHSLEAMQQWDMLEFQRDAADRREFYRKLREEQSAPPVPPVQPAVKNSELKHDPPLNGALMCAREHKSGKWCVLPREHKGMHRTSGIKEEPIYWQDKDRVKNQQNDQTIIPAPDRNVYPHTTRRRAGRTAFCRCGHVACSDEETWGDDCPIAMRTTLAAIRVNTLEKAAKVCEKLAIDYARETGDGDRLDVLEAAAFAIRDLMERDPAGDGT